MNEITVEIQKLVNGGQGLGLYQGKPVFAWNTLPGETAAVKVAKEKKNYLEGIAVGISNTAPERIDPKEEHYLSCGPWQIMRFAYENYWKRKIAKETFKKIGGLELPEAVLVVGQDLFGYRNKIEYGFYTDKSSNKLQFAFHRRGSAELSPIDTCLLAKGNINKAAINILDRLNKAKVGAANLKSLILRSNRDGQVLVSLLVTNKNFKMEPDVIINDILIGFHIYYSNSP
ncbi:MAG TPA: TRAM domain-containing protein, partial [Actinobacteria bacterium]|nr:TRAM domain-containing protein [Actinomycetes bacterium]HEX21572.1 TRAM domain-containing protein [Actinomycetota bacterium]